jgi:hypothetical protein
MATEASLDSEELRECSAQPEGAWRPFQRSQPARLFFT